ncbi:MAG: response regulator transcription factor [Dehalococcoidales bacterium]|nr:response regulator transcription factor [Dehalococcoidales bacterium]
MIKVLVVDDHPVFRRGLISMMQNQPEFQVVGEAANGVEAVAKALELQPHVIVMDLRMPGGDGVAATAALQQKLPRTKVLIPPVSEKDDDLFAAVEAGAKGYLLKSVDFDELISSIRSVAAGDVIISPALATRVIVQLKQKKQPRTGEDSAGLTPRETEVMQLVAQGASNKEVATELFISETTVKAHLRSVLEKLQVKNRAQAVARATAMGLLK